jgi:hypothetical protein
MSPEMAKEYRYVFSNILLSVTLPLWILALGLQYTSLFTGNQQTLILA